jgi:hypothetical protein
MFYDESRIPARPRMEETPMTNLVFAAVAALTLSISVAKAQSLSYNTPAHNYYQNNWMNGRG